MANRAGALGPWGRNRTWCAAPRKNIENCVHGQRHPCLRESTCRLLLGPRDGT